MNVHEALEKVVMTMSFLSRVYLIFVFAYLYSLWHCFLEMNNVFYTKLGILYRNNLAK